MMEVNNDLQNSLQSPVPNSLQVPEGAWTHGPVTLSRGRTAKDPQTQTTSYSVSSIEEFETSLRQYLDETSLADAHHAEGHFNFWIGSSFLVNPPGLSPQERVALEASEAARQNREKQSNPSSQQQQQTQPQPQPQQRPQQQTPSYPSSSLEAHYATATQGQQLNGQNAAFLPNGLPHNARIEVEGRGFYQLQVKVPMSILEALQPTGDPKERMRKQRAIAKVCVDTIQKVDGFRYSFHNNWKSREDDAYRFSYYCNDSLLNKDRAANGKGQKAGKIADADSSTHPDLAAARKRATKAVYDCRGVLAVKFSAVKQSLDIHYRHVPVHRTYEERAPPPRRDSKRRRLMEHSNPEVLQQAKAQKQTDTAQPEPNTLEPPPKKKKSKKGEKELPTNSIESSLRAQSLQSLLELIRTNDDSVGAPPTVPPLDPSLTNPTPRAATATTASVSTTMNGTSPSVPPTKRRPRAACDSCRAKRTGCDSARPACKQCTDRGRHCTYSGTTDSSERSLTGPQQLEQYAEANMPNSTANPSPIQHTAQSSASLASTAANAVHAMSEMSDLEKMKAELEAARQKIAQLEAERKAASPVTLSPSALQNTPVQSLNQIANMNTNMTPQLGQPRRPDPKTQSQSQTQQQQFQGFQPQGQVPVRHDSYARQQLQPQSLQQQQHQTQHQQQHQQQPQHQQQQQHTPQHNQNQHSQMQAPSYPQWPGPTWPQQYGYQPATHPPRTDQWNGRTSGGSLFRGA